MTGNNTDNTNFNWESSTKQQYDALISKVPVFMRGMAEEKVARKISEILARENFSEVNQKVMVDAFFAATPFGFHGPMKSDMEELGIDYRQYGHS